MVDYTITQNDTYPPIRGVCKDEDGDPVNLAGASVRFIMQPSGEEADTVNAAGSVEDEAGGVVSYSWQVGDTAEPGIYCAEFEVTHSGGGIETFPRHAPLAIRIRAELG
jgi:hypothetical protein